MTALEYDWTLREGLTRPIFIAGLTPEPIPSDLMERPKGDPEGHLRPMPAIIPIEPRAVRPSDFLRGPA